MKGYEDLMEKYNHLIVGETYAITKALNELDIRYINDSGDIYIQEKDYTNYKITLAYKGIL